MQISSLYCDKDFLNGNTTKVELDTNMVETHVGFRRVYDWIIYLVYIAT